MKKGLLFLFILVSISTSFSFEKKSIIERYTNYQCGPCANLNNTWYNAVVGGLVQTNTAVHIVYNVNWPGPNDPMYLLNAAQNSLRWRYYGVNSVPWIVVNGTTIPSDQSALQTAVTTGNASYSPFKIELIPERFSNNVINVKVIIIRDTADVTVFDENTKLKIGITEKAVAGGSGALEAFYYDITRRMLPDARGMNFEIPAPGDSVEVETFYIPSAEFLSSVIMDSLRAVVFIQNDGTKEIYQSAVEDVALVNHINAAFEVEENLGGLPMTAVFTSYSTGENGAPITQYQWDFNNDGTIDSQDPAPEFTYTAEGKYSVKLIVSDGTNQHTRIVTDFITVVSSESDVLVVNGIDYSNATYIPEMIRFYGSSAPYGNQLVDIWDLFGDEGFDYTANAQVQKVHLFNRGIPMSVLKLYNKVVWIGNNYSGDLTFFDPAQVIEYLGLGGNFLFAARMASQFFDVQLRTYAGITGFTGDLTVAQLNAADSNLVNMGTMGTNNYVNIFTLDPTSEAIPIFTDNATGQSAGFRMQKQNEGAFIFIAGRPYRYDTTSSKANYDYIIQNWMTGQIVSTKEKDNTVPSDFSLSQNYPNPFNPSTTINYQVAKSGKVVIRIYDILGNEISTLVNREVSPGSYSVKFNADKLSSGMYIYRMDADGVSISRKMLLMK